ncbi:hypothetical protein [Lactobacillus kalixensis]|uniref:Uncharacterized protein n=1 Tax=Lactobacillus kalixensis DSM 16043 TaxID=1423763 RepID=A0A0R1UAZ5_9LACO|nr:hypothetical protein [Lactobacillus kalixensis]KRL89860.1 hypothetical protein FC46_GL000508 [Lactobacillus kalixensis DSM 16043]
MAITKREDLFDPEVLAPMVQNTTQNAMVFMPLADIDRTLVGNPGDTLTVPTWGHIGAAEEVAEGEQIPVEKLGQGYTKATVSKFGKGVSFTDEADITALGNVVEQATRQIGEVIAQGADSKLMEAALKVKNTMTVTPDVDGVDAMQSFFDTDVNNPAYTLIVSPKTKLKLNKAVREYTKGSDVGAQLAINGASPLVLGTSIYATKKMADDKIIVVFSSDADIARSKELQEKMKNGNLTDKELETLNSGRAFKWLVKRDTLIEADRDKGKQINTLYGTQIAAPYVQNPSKVLVATLGNEIILPESETKTDSKDETIKVESVNETTPSTKPDAKSTVEEIKAYLDANHIDYTGKTKKDELLALVK